MEYEIVELSEKTAVGFIAQTNNASPDMGMVIGGLWEKFYGPEGYEKIQHKVNQKSMGIYTDYASNEKGDYSIFVACEVDKAEELPKGTVMRKIPAGKYAKFIVEGDMHRAVAEFWEKLWQMDLDRNFLCDYEEYQNSDMDHAVIHMYIGIK